MGKFSEDLRQILRENFTYDDPKFMVEFSKHLSKNLRENLGEFLGQPPGTKITKGYEVTQFRPIRVQFSVCDVCDHLRVT